MKYRFFYPLFTRYIKRTTKNSSFFLYVHDLYVYSADIVNSGVEQTSIIRFCLNIVPLSASAVIIDPFKIAEKYAIDYINFFFAVNISDSEANFRRRLLSVSGRNIFRPIIKCEKLLLEIFPVPVKIKQLFF